LAIVALLATSAVGCNLIGFLDAPAGDAQLLSAARAALDRADYAKALELYGKMSSSHAEVAASETAIALLDQEGASMGAFMSSFGTSIGGDTGIGKGLTNLASYLKKTGTPGPTKRTTMYRALTMVNDITSAENKELRGLVRFLSSAGLLAEILAEDIGTSGTYTTADLVTTPSGCSTTTVCTPVAPAACNPPGSKNLSSTYLGTIDISGAGPDFAIVETYLADPVMTTDDASLELINAVLGELINGINEMGATAGLGAGFKDFANEIINTAGSALSVPATANCYRATLIELGIGSN